MNERLNEIESRLSAIKRSLDAKEEGIDIDALVKEADELRSERNRIESEEKARQERLSEVANNKIPTKIIEERKEKNAMPEFGIDSAEYRSAYLKNLMGKELTEQERLVDLSGALPTSTANKVLAIVEESRLLSKLDISHIPGNLDIPIETESDEASWGTTGAAVNDAIGTVQLYAYQLIKTIDVPGTIKAASIDAFETYLTKRLGQKIRKTLEAAVINGDGNGKATGISVTVNTLTGTFTKAGIVKADLFKIMGSLDGEFQDNATWIMPSKVYYGEVLGVVSINDFANLANGGGEKLLGKDVILTEKAKISNADYIFYGDPDHYHLNFSEDINVAKDASVGFKSNSVTYRGVTVCDGKLDSAKAFVKYTRAT